MAKSSKIVKELQQLLKNKGYDPGPIDGDLGQKTLDAVKKAVTDATKPVTNKVAEVKPVVVQKAQEVVNKVVEAVKPPPPVPQIDANTLKGKDRPLYVKKVLTDLGWKDFQAASIVGQAMQESYQDLRTNVWGDKGTAFGICQWRDFYDKATGVHSPGRLTDLLQFANDLKKPIDDLDTQARFINWELTKGSEKGIGKRLAATKNIDEALEVAIGYERPVGYSKDNPRNGHGWANREKYAKSLL